MSEHPKKCPKCGAESTMITETAAMYRCGYSIGDTWMRMGEQCLFSQLAAANAEIVRLRVKLRDFESGEILPLSELERLRDAERIAWALRRGYEWDVSGNGKSEDFEWGVPPINSIVRILKTDIEGNKSEYWMSRFLGNLESHDTLDVTILTPEARAAIDAAMKGEG